MFYKYLALSVAAYQENLFSESANLLVEAINNMSIKEYKDLLEKAGIKSVEDKLLSASLSTIKAPEDLPDIVNQLSNSIHEALDLEVSESNMITENDINEMIDEVENDDLLSEVDLEISNRSSSFKRDDGYHEYDDSYDDDPIDTFDDLTFDDSLSSISINEDYADYEDSDELKGSE